MKNIIKKLLTDTKGATVMELSVAALITGIVTAGIVNFFQQSQHSMNKIGYSQEALSSNLHAAYWLFQDLKSASRSSVNSYVLNGGFEQASAVTGMPLYWSDEIKGDGDFRYIESNSEQAVHSGLRSIILDQNGSKGVEYDSDIFVLLPGMSYMITAWVRCRDADSKVVVELVDDKAYPGNTLESKIIADTEWAQVVFIYPKTDLLMIRKKVLIRIFIDTQSNHERVYIDDFACTPINSVMVSLKPKLITIESSVNDPFDPNDPVGFRFIKWKDKEAILHRYRLDRKLQDYYITKEIFDDTLGWVAAGIHHMGLGIENLSFSYDAKQLPVNGKDTALRVSTLLRDRIAKKEDVYVQPDSLIIFPSVE
ncbi:MAG: hypothetical protein ABII23_03030 [bacterium]